MIDDQQIGTVNSSVEQQFHRGVTGKSTKDGFDLFGQKRPQNAGPIGDLFFEQLLLVPGTAGSAEETFFNNWMTDNTASYFRSWNGGWAPGQNCRRQRYRPDNRTGLRFKEEEKIDLPLAETTTFCYWALIGPMSFWLNLRDD